MINFWAMKAGNWTKNVFSCKESQFNILLLHERSAFPSTDLRLWASRFCLGWLARVGKTSAPNRSEKLLLVSRKINVNKMFSVAIESIKPVHMTMAALGGATWTESARQLPVCPWSTFPSTNPILWWFYNGASLPTGFGGAWSDDQFCPFSSRWLWSDSERRDLRQDKHLNLQSYHLNWNLTQLRRGVFIQ